MIKLHAEQPTLLKEGDYVKFVSSDRRAKFSPDVYAGATFKVTKTQRVVFDRAFIIPPNDYTELDLSNDGLGLYPERPTTLYEILIGLKGSKEMLIYIQIPAGKYLNRLEKSDLYPVPADPTRRYLGFIDLQASTIDEPKLLVYSLKDMESIIFQVYNDSSDYQKIIFRFLVNKCQIAPVKPEEAKEPKLIWHWEDLAV